MRLFIVIVLLFCTECIGFAQNAQRHCVQRGENLFTIAQKYRLPVSEIERANPNMGKILFPGLILNIPESTGTLLQKGQNVTQESKTSDFDLKKFDAAIAALEEEERQQKAFDNFFNQAQTEFDKRNYKHAIKYYKKAIKIMEDDYAYYNIAAASYNIGNYKDAVKNLKKCLNITTTTSVRKKASDLLADCNKEIAYRREQRSAAWSSALGNLFMTAANTTQSVMMSKNSYKGAVGGSRYSSGSSYSEDSGSDDSYSSSTSSSGSSKRCRKCMGTGTCYRCNGKGEYFDNSYGIAKYYDCSTCGKSGKCPLCHGSGTK